MYENTQAKTLFNLCKKQESIKSKKDLELELLSLKLDIKRLENKAKWIREQLKQQF